MTKSRNTNDLIIKSIKNALTGHPSSFVERTIKDALENYDNYCQEEAKIEEEEEENKVLERIDLLKCEFEDLKTEHALEFKELNLNLSILRYLVNSYFHDVRRYKDFHGKGSLINEWKKGGFTIKWILKLRPVQFDVEPKQVNAKMLYANEIFALHSGFSLAEIDIKNNVVKKMLNESMDEILYTFKFRPIDEGQLFLWLATIERMLKLQP